LTPAPPRARKLRSGSFGGEPDTLAPGFTETLLLLDDQGSAIRQPGRGRPVMPDVELELALRPKLVNPTAG
jgi:hypothetical protein